jgi:predicted esterase
MTRSGPQEADYMTGYGWYGDSIEGMKALFPTTPFHINPDQDLWWVTDYWVDGDFNAMAGLHYQKNPNCELGIFKSCSYDLEKLDLIGKSIKALIENEIDNNGIRPENIFLAGFSQGGQIVYHTALG